MRNTAPSATSRSMPVDAGEGGDDVGGEAGAVP